MSLVQSTITPPTGDVYRLLLNSRRVIPFTIIKLPAFIVPNAIASTPKSHFLKIVGFSLCSALNWSSAAIWPEVICLKILQSKVFICVFQGARFTFWCLRVRSWIGRIKRIMWFLSAALSVVFYLNSDDILCTCKHGHTQW